LDKKGDERCEHGQRDSFIDLARDYPLMRFHSFPNPGTVGARPELLSRWNNSVKEALRAPTNYVAQQIRQLGDVGRDAPRLVARQS
jgi:hypothetical protein